MVSYEMESFSWEFSDPARKINIYPEKIMHVNTDQIAIFTLPEDNSENEK